MGGEREEGEGKEGLEETGEEKRAKEGGGYK